MSDIEDMVYGMDAEDLQDFAIGNAEVVKELESQLAAANKRVEDLEAEIKKTWESGYRQAEKDFKGRVLRAIEPIAAAKLP